MFCACGKGPFVLRLTSCNALNRRKQIIVRAEMRNGYRDEYAVLGLTPLSSKKDVKQAYRRLALQYHPDLNKVENGHKFRQINIAYESIMGMLEVEELVEDEANEWEEWMGFEVGFPIAYKLD
eukprot:Gb_35032 [translate_table: standard]